VRCSGGRDDKPAQYFIGWMLYNRWWFAHDKYALTLGGGAIDNPGRYLVLVPPINGATAASGTPYFTANPGDPFRAWDASASFDVMPNGNVTTTGRRTSPTGPAPAALLPPAATAARPVPPSTASCRTCEKRRTA